MPAGSEILLLGIPGFAASAVACAVALAVLRRWIVLDAPNARSSHIRPVPRGGGVGFIPVILALWTYLWLSGDGAAPPSVILGACAIGLVSFADDVRGVPAAARLAVQAAGVFVVLFTLPADTAIISDTIPPVADRLIAGVGWLWFVNLFNFMDGIDGLAASEAIVIGAGIVGLAIWRADFGLPWREAIVVAAAAAAFLLFNWHPARLFMGDVGSVVLGYLLGWLLLVTARAGAPLAAFLLPLYFSADATSTLLMRAWRGVRLGEAHRDHAYQKAVDRGDGQVPTTLAVVVLGVLLAGLAILSTGMPLTAFGAGVALTGALIGWQRSYRGKRVRDG